MLAQIMGHAAGDFPLAAISKISKCHSIFVCPDMRRHIGGVTEQSRIKIGGRMRIARGDVNATTSCRVYDQSVPRLAYS